MTLSTAASPTTAPQITVIVAVHNVQSLYRGLYKKSFAARVYRF